MNEEEKIKDLKAVYSGAVQAGEIGIANMIKGGIDLIEKLQKENELAKKQVEYDKTHICTPQIIKLNYIPIQKVKDKIEELQKEYNKLDKQVDEYIKSAEKDVSTYYENKERISIIQTLSYFIGILQELLESEE